MASAASSSFRPFPETVKTGRSLLILERTPLRKIAHEPILGFRRSGRRDNPVKRRVVVESRSIMQSSFVDTTRQEAYRPTGLAANRHRSCVSPIRDKNRLGCPLLKRQDQ
jgi:hypothetical protein